MTTITSTAGFVPVEPPDDDAAADAASDAAGSDAASTAAPDRASGGARLSAVASSLVGTDVVWRLRVAPDAISYVEGALAMLPSAEAATTRRLLREAAELDQNRVLTRAEAEKVIEPAIAELPGGAAAVREALGGIDAFLDAERAREADLRDGIDVLFNSDRQGPSITARVIAELDEAVAEADGRPLDVHIMIFSFTDESIAARLESIARENPNVHIRMIADWSQTTTANGYKPAVLARLGLPNLEVKFKKDQPYRWDARNGRMRWDHGTSRGLNHHKGLVTLIDGRPRSLVTGSFNWSPTAERSNYENLMVLDADVAANRTVMRHYGEEFEAFWNDGRASLTLGEAREHRRRIGEEFEADPTKSPEAIVGLERGAGADLHRLADEDIVDLNSWTGGQRIAELVGGGGRGMEIARVMQAERLRYGRFADLQDLVSRVPAVGALGAGALERLSREAVFGRGLVSANTATREELMAIGASGPGADAILAWRAEHGDFESVAAVGAVPGVSASSFARMKRFLSAAVNRVAFSARMAHEERGDTGYAPLNEEKTVPVLGPDGEVHFESATLGSGAIDMIRRAEPGETLKLATYGLSSSTPEYAALLEAARRGVKLRVILNKAYNEGVAARLRALAEEEELDVEVKVSGRTMHQKYLVHPEGKDAFNGSANLSGSSALRHSEDRFFLKNNEALARAFETDFDRLWGRLRG